MKKIWNIFIAIALIVTPFSYVLACTWKSTQEELKFWENNYQYGPQKEFKTQSASNNQYIDYFFGKPEFNYATYLIEANSVEETIISETVKFNGDLENVKKTPLNQSELKLWKNDTQSTQLILFKENSEDVISDLKIEILNSKDEDIEINANFIKPIKAKNTINNIYNPASPKAVFYNYDEIATNELSSIKLDFQPLLITAKTNDQTQVGKRDVNFKLTFKANSVEQQIDFRQELNVVDMNINRANEQINAISSDSMSFPTSSQKFVLKQFDKVITKKSINLSQKEYDNLFNLTEQEILKIIKDNNISMPSDTKIIRWEDEENEGEIFRKDKDNKHVSILIQSDTYFVTNKAANKINGQDNPTDKIQIYFNNPNPNPNPNKSINKTKGYDQSVYVKPTFKNDSVTSVFSNPDKNYSRLVNYKNSLHDFLVKEDNENENRSLDNKYGRKFSQLKQENNAKYGYVPNFGLGYIKYTATNNNLKTVDDFWSSVDKNNLADIFNEDLEWSINFDILDEYMNFLNESGYEKIFIPVTARNANPFNFYYKTDIDAINQSGGNAQQKVLANITYKNKFIDPSGNISKDYEVLRDEIIAILTKNLVTHINKIKANNSSTYYDAYNNIDIYYSFDETKQEINEKVIDTYQLEDPENLIKTHAYIGWEFEVEDYYNVDELEQKFNPYDEITLQQREYIFNYEKGSQKDVSNFRKLVEDRHSQEKNTRFYSSWQNFPGGYLSSVPGDLTWSTLMAYKYGTNGFDRFQLDGFYSNDISLDGYILGHPHEPADASLIYPGDSEKIYDSLRLVNLQNGIKLVWKLITLEQENKISAQDALKIRNYIKWNNDIRSNIEYKWTTNLNDTITINNFDSENDTVYTQIFKIKEFVNMFS
ncbi:glycoside hydrolase domain-containing protein [Spiroplasma floricola]|uniref:Glycoside hydrolase 123 catalytic domain-containing protein n=1 Tax=Spiroplasma floricola 23-6 TaxID=1336749 RepID=A0A2K8SDQ9_9MOLU|nr:glycoside hydrolase domain-containing protein [Spiroplasma floricola]AUB31594.1 hypothetical protein SFLOR_v1c05420 [Spiroplasma floricola 23-6]